ncbi:MAG: histidine kinase [Nocardioides sp.]
MTATAERRAREHATALEQERARAAAEERRRVARELHDGVAQQVVALGYLVDELAGLLETDLARAACTALREVVGSVARELRGSVEDLRSEASSETSSSETSLPASLAAYVAELDRRCDLRFHLEIDERGQGPGRDVEREVLRIAQEAIANVRQHARASNVWIRLSTDSHRLRLVVEDDGIGHVAPRRGHFGLLGMHERAERIEAALGIGDRPDGGTVVTLTTGIASAPIMEGDSDDRSRLARR